MVNQIKPGSRPELGEVRAAQGKDLWLGYNSFGQQVNYNTFFSGTRQYDLAAQTKEMDDSDPRLYGLTQTRKLSILSLKREIVGDGPEADFVRETLAGIPNFHMSFYGILSCIQCGYSVTELIWAVVNGRFVIADMKARYPDRFTFSRPDWELRLKTTSNMIDGEPVHPDKFKVLTFMEEYGDRWGQPLYQKIYWYWYLKKAVQKFYNIYVERFAGPLLTISGEMSAEEKVIVDAFLAEVKAHTGCRLPKDCVPTIIEASQNGAATYESFMDYLDRGMAIAILGQSTRVDNRTVGSYASDAIADIVTRGDILGFDILMCENFFNDQIIKPLVDYNFANVKEYPKWRITKGRISDLNLAAQIIEKLIVLGLPVTKSYIYETFGIPIPQDDGDILIYNKPQALPFGGQQFSEQAKGIMSAVIAQNFIKEIEKL